mgnify:CR=1 FL=1
MEPLLRVVNLSKSFGTLPALQQVSFQVQPGEVMLEQRVGAIAARPGQARLRVSYLQAICNSGFVTALRNLGRVLSQRGLLWLVGADQEKGQVIRLRGLPADLRIVKVMYFDAPADRTPVVRGPGVGALVGAGVGLL